MTIVKSSSAGTETFKEGIVTLPETAVKFRAFIQINGVAPFAGVLKVRRPLITKMANANLIVDGAITADKIDTGAISIGHMSTKTQEDILNDSTTTGLGIK